MIDYLDKFDSIASPCAHVCEADYMVIQRFVNARLLVRAKLKQSLVRYFIPLWLLITIYTKLLF